MMRAARAALVVVAVIAVMVPGSSRAHSTVAHGRITRFTALPGSAPAPATATTLACGTRLSEVDATDANIERWQVIYFVPKNACDEQLDIRPTLTTKSTLEKSINSLNAWLVREGSRPMRIDHTPAGYMDIVFLRGNKTSYADIDDISAELSSRGYAKSFERYIIFAATKSSASDAICGEAYWPGEYAVTYLNSTAACGTRGFGNGTISGAGTSEVVTGQEALHNEGVVYLVAPHQCVIGLSIPLPTGIGHVCTPGLWLTPSLDPEGKDIMYPYVFGQKLSAKQLDPGHDDYFKTPLIEDLDESGYFG